MADNSTAVSPLSWNVPIVDPQTGVPTQEFMLKWQAQKGVNGQVNSAIAPTSLLANPTAKSAVPVPTTVSKMLDAAIGTTSGSLLVRGASAWEQETLSALIDAVLGSTVGGLLVRTGGGWSVLAPGANGTKLTISGGVPVWM